MPLMFDDLPQPEGNKRLMFDDLPAPSVGQDIAKTIPSAAVRGVTSGLGLFGDLQAKPELAPSAPGTFTSYLEKARNFLEPPQLPTSATLRGAAEKVTGPLYEAQTTPGRYAGAATESLTNPISYLGPGSVPLKLATAATSGLTGQAGEDVAGKPGAIVGSVLGGAGANRVLGPRAIEAATPKAAELKAAAQQGTESQFGGYQGALTSGLELDPTKVAPVAYGIEQRLNAKGFTGGPNGTAKGTLGDIQSLQQPPANSTITAANLDTLRTTLGRRASETTTNAAGVTRPTQDALAARDALNDLRSYTENIPASHIVAGDARAYSNAINEANANYAAAMRTKSAEDRIFRATRNYESRPNVTYGSQLKNQFRGQVNYPERTPGFTQAEREQLYKVNAAGGKVVDLLGSRSIPAMTVHGLAGLGTLGLSVPFSVAANYGSRKLGSALTSRQADKLAEMLAQRSPLYQSRELAAAATPNNAAAVRNAALIRSLLTAR